ncbi:MAG: SDR family oxidoreductase [Campylobacter sp.]|nr:SDR family oxidoreductase [Campylobacter sp.]
MKEKIAIVTGGTSGIGASICKFFKENGIKVISVARHKPNKQIYGEFMVCDVTDEESVKSLFKAVLDKYGRVDIVVNNAGITGANLHTHELAYDEFTKVMRVNVGGTFLVSKYALNAMIAQKSGVIINIASVLGMVGSENFDAYAPSKGAIIAMTKQHAYNYAKYGIRVNSVSPATVMTELVESIKNQMGDEAFETIFDKPHPLGGVGEPSDVAEAVLYLANAKWVTGTNLVVDGGYLSH